MAARVKRSARGRVAAALLTALALGGALAPAGGAPGAARARFDRSGIRGSGAAVMQPVNVGVRIALLAARPGTTETWAVGRSTAKLPGWAGEAGGGQTVFLRYRRGAGWKLVGPPVDAGGKIANPRLTSLSVAANGDGWAGGDGGALYHLEEGRWVARPLPGFTSVITSVSLVSNGLGTHGFAIAEGPVALRLQSGAWTTEPITVPEGERWELESVAAASASEAWAGGASGRSALLVRRTAGGWQRITTGDELFDEDRQPRRAGSVVVASARVMSVSATSRGAWFGGALIPVDVGASLGDPAGDATRPFAISVGSSGTVTTYCPDQYAVGTDGATTTTQCDKAFPLSGFGLASIAALPNGEVFAGGLGMFRFAGGTWFREPSALGYLTAVAMASPREGWVASTGDTVGARGSVSSIATLGHWTTSPAPERMARWPQPVSHPNFGITEMLEGVAIAPDGSGRAFAVGRGGSSVLYRPGVGWDTFTPVSGHAFHAVAWPGETGWAVGGHGIVYRFDERGPVQHAASETLTTASLFGVAFSSPDRGYAVGANGTILRFSNGRWSVDPASLKLSDADLYGITAAGSEFVAVGGDGTVLVTRGGRWHRETGLERLLARGGSVAQGGQMPALYAVAGLDDGTVFAGGELSTLIRRDGRGGAWRVDDEGDRVPPEGTILALAARRAGAATELLASVSYEVLKYSGESPGVTTGFVLRGTRRGWEDLDHNTRFSAYATFDASAPRDPVYDIAWDGRAAWAVGGTGPGNDDAMGHVASFATSSIYRIDPSGDPRPSGFSTVPELETAPGVVSFAYFGESACGRGLCGAAIGTGTKADVVAQQIQDEVNRMAKLPGGPKFVVFGGNMRRTGIPEELGQFKRYLDGFDVPAFAALGGRDLFAGLEPSVLEDQEDYGLGVKSQTQVKATHTFFADLFSDRPRPWGNATALRDFRPVGEESVSGARTHYAFDYAPGGIPRLRIIVLDDSAPGRLTDPSTQNPPRDQGSWLRQMLDGADWPRIVVMNRPASNPLDLTRPQNFPEAEPIQRVAAQVGASAVLTSFFRLNAVDVVKIPGVAGTVPVYVFGGGGAPLEARTGNPPRPPHPSLGYYHSWQLVSVDLSRRVNAELGQYEVAVRSFPVLDNVALHAVDGTQIAAGNTLRFVGSGRAPDGGGPGDPLQSKAVVLPFDFSTRGVCPPDPDDNNRPKCQGSGAVGSMFLFASEDPRIGFFVRPSPLDGRLPALNGAGDPIPDATSGLFCAVKAGSTFVNIVSGFHRSRMQVTVGGGFGPCVKAPVPPLPVTPDPPKPPDPPLEEPAGPLPLTHTAAENQSVALVPPPPVPVVAPAPPAAGGFARKEQHEEAREDASQKFTALPLSSRFEPRPEEAFPLGAAAGVVGVVGALVAGMVVRTRRDTALARVRMERRRR